MYGEKLNYDPSIILECIVCQSNNKIDRFACTTNRAKWGVLGRACAHANDCGRLIEVPTVAYRSIRRSRNALNAKGLIELL